MDWGHALKNGNFVTFDVVVDHIEKQTLSMQSL